MPIFRADLHARTALLPGNPRYLLNGCWVGLVLVNGKTSVSARIRNLVWFCPQPRHYIDCSLLAEAVNFNDQSYRILHSTCLYTVLCTISTLSCPLSLHCPCTLCTLYCALSLHCPVHSLYTFLALSVHCTVHCLYTVLCTVSTLSCALSPQQCYSRTYRTLHSIYSCSAVCLHSVTR